MSELKCCVVSCDKPLDASYWESQYEAKTTGWDLGKVSPPIQIYVDTVDDKNCSILIPGCGNSYETEYLLEQGFTNITVVDIAPTPVAAPGPDGFAVVTAAAVVPCAELAVP